MLDPAPGGLGSNAVRRAAQPANDRDRLPVPDDPRLSRVRARRAALGRGRTRSSSDTWPERPGTGRRTCGATDRAPARSAPEPPTGARSLQVRPDPAIRVLGDGAAPRG